MRPRHAMPPGVRLPAHAILATVWLFFAGCHSTSYVVQVDAISQTGPAGPDSRALKSYKVVSSNPRNAEDTLRYHEVSDYLKTALSGRGLYEAPSAESADLIVTVDYGIETPRMKYETVTVSQIIRRRISAREAANGNASSADVFDVRDEVQPTIVYEKYLKVSARENKEGVEGRAPAEVWSVNVSAEDQSQELRKYIPILASATADYIGTNTKEAKAVRIDEGDDAVKFIKKGM